MLFETSVSPAYTFLVNVRVTIKLLSQLNGFAWLMNFCGSDTAGSVAFLMDAKPASISQQHEKELFRFDLLISSVLVTDLVACERGGAGSWVVGRGSWRLL